MTTRIVKPDACEQMLRENAAISELVTTLYRVMTERHEPVGRLVQLVKDLRERIEAHFDDEEASELFDQLCRQVPQRATAVDQLRNEHEEMRERLRSLLKRIEHASLSPEVWSVLEHEFRDFTNLLTQHEARENQLVQTAYDEDVGAGD